MELFMKILPYAVAVILGYACGCINPAHLFAKKKKVDILALGSKNPGASNATITMGWEIGVLVGLIDALKAIVPILVIRFAFPDMPIAEAIAGVCAVLGHIFPVQFGFRGGKGFATFLGMVIAIDWRFFIAIGIGIVLITLVTDYLALATLTTVVAEPILIAVFKAQYIVVAVVCIASLVIILRHRENIQKIATGREIRFSSALKKK